MRHQARHHGYIYLDLIAGRLLVEFLFRSPCLYLSMSSKFLSKILGDQFKIIFIEFYFYVKYHICFFLNLISSNILYTQADFSFLYLILSLIVSSMAQWDHNILHLHLPFLLFHLTVTKINNLSGYKVLTAKCKLFFHSIFSNISVAHNFCLPLLCSFFRSQYNYSKNLLS